MLTSMTSKQQKHVSLDEWHLDFIQRHITVNVSSRDANNIPTLVRGFGCRVLDGGQRVAVYVPRISGQRVLQSLASHGMIAVVCSRPSTHEALQLKGEDARVAALDSEDQQAMRLSIESFLEEVKMVGFSDYFIAALRAMFAEEVVAIIFTPTNAFVQTPGPQAGQVVAS